MKKIILCVFVGIAFMFVACGKQTTDVTMNERYVEVVKAYQFEELAENTVQNEDGSVTYTIANSSLKQISEQLSTNLKESTDAFVDYIHEANPDIVVEISFNEDATVLEGTVTDAFGAANGMFLLLLQSYADIVATQIISGIEPSGLTLKMTDAETGELFEEVLPF